MESLGTVRKAVWALGVVAVAVVLCGCPAEEQKPAKPALPTKKAEPAAEPAAKPSVPEPVAPAAKPAESEPAVKEGPVLEPPTPKAKPAVTEPKSEDVAPKPAATEPKSDDVTPKPAATEPKSEDVAPKPAEAEPKKEDVGQKPAAAKPEQPEEQPEMPKILDLGAPLVDDPTGLKKLDPQRPIWVDIEHKQVIFLGKTCRAEYPLEFLVTDPERGYEACAVTQVKPSTVHAALLAVGAKTGSPVQYEPKYAPPTGTEIEIEVRWKDKAGKVQHASAQQWIRNIKTKKPLDVNWVFAGSLFRKNSEGRVQYLADGGDFIAVLNLPTAMLDIPIASTGAIESRSFEGFVENMPAEGTPATFVLRPKAK